MSILKITASRDQWLESVYNKSNSYASLNAYREGIKAWDDFLLTKNQSDSIILSEFKKGNNDPETYLYLNQFIQFMIKRESKRATIDINFAALRSWCAENGIMLFNEYIKRFVKLPKAIKETRVPLNHDIIRALITNSPNQIRVILLVLLSSGMRINEVLQLRVKDFEESDPIKIKVRAATTKSRAERLAYISSEAWEMVKPLLIDKSPEDLVFIKEHTENSVISFETRFSRVRRNLGLTEKYDDGKRYHVNVHAFRANFMTQATKVLDGDTAHALIGHKKYLDVYFRLVSMQNFDMFIIP